MRRYGSGRIVPLSDFSSSGRYVLSYRLVDDLSLLFGEGRWAEGEGRCQIILQSSVKRCVKVLFNDSVF